MEERRNQSPLSPERAENLVAASEVVSGKYGSQEFCTIRVDDTIDDLRTLLTEAYKMKGDTDIQAAEQSGSGRADIVRNEYAEMEARMLDHLEEIHNRLKPAIPFRIWALNALKSLVGLDI